MSEIATRTPAQNLVAQIRSEEFRNQLADALPEGLSVDRFTRITTTALLEAPELADPKVDRQSLFLAIIKSAQLGLLPNKSEAAIVLFGNKATLMPMVGGFRKIAGEHGWTIRSAAVYERDEFDYQVEPPTLFHKPTMGERGEIIAAYAVARHTDGRQEQRVMRADEIEKRRKVAKSDNIWKQWPAEMSAKTVVRDLFAELPLDPTERIKRVLADTTEPGASADTLYGPSEIPAGDSAARTGSGDGSPTAPQPSTPSVAAPTEEPGPDPEPAEIAGEEADVEKLAAQAASFIPPSGKFGPQPKGANLTLAEIAGHPKGPDWFDWALSSLEKPPEYVAAVWSFARVFLPEQYQAAIAKKELA